MESIYIYRSSSNSYELGIHQDPRLGPDSHWFMGLRLRSATARLRSATARLSSTDVSVYFELSGRNLFKPNQAPTVRKISTMGVPSTSSGTADLVREGEIPFQVRQRVILSPGPFGEQLIFQPFTIIPLPYSGNPVFNPIPHRSLYPQFCQIRSDPKPIVGEMQFFRYIENGFSCYPKLGKIKCLRQILRNT